MFAEEIKIRIEKLFGRKISLCKKIDSGYVNNLFLVRIHDSAYIVKIYNTCLSLKQILFSIEVQGYLSTIYLAPRIISVLDDATPIISVQEYVNNCHKKLNHSYECGLLLGSIHRALYYYQSSLAPDFDIISLQHSISSLNNCDLTEKEKILFEKKIELASHINLPISGERQIIHGDYHNDNILCSNNRYVSIDFDEAKVFYRVYDVIKVIINLALRLGLSESKHYANAFLLGYGQCSRLLTVEIDNMFDIYIGALSAETSGLGTKRSNFDEGYIDKRIALHEFVLSEEKNIRIFLNNLNYKIVGEK